ncbi:MIP/aquaporin family protein [Planctomyces sp. SH-PL14]|uniref:MIP/aquaporin family protein n=1 Tax=Planctomyces sp. SH-PL14 TaxID=1632864 RepID=UPI00078B9907|nr:MIP/aquaporin family protein [Planctomyces sp. SH-PL14]AMV17631.1 Glycerol uptake facilitator protein [Planctomyces sp. SH-PL14]
MASPATGEFLGTLILILLGDGVVADVLLNRSKAHNSGWIVITAGWAFAVACGIFTSKAFGGPGALNPVGPLTDMVIGGKAVADSLVLIAAQFAGAFAGAVLVWLHFLPHWKETPDAAAKLGVFCTAPAIRNAPANLLSEAIGTFVLVLVASSVSRAAVGGLEPAAVGLVVWAIGLSLGGTTGYAINPARDLAPRLAHALLPIAGKGSSDWGYAWIPVVGPCIGALLGAALFAWGAAPAP